MGFLRQGLERRIRMGRAGLAPKRRKQQCRRETLKASILRSKFATGGPLVALEKEEII